MNGLCIDFSYDDNVKREINSLNRKIEKRANDYRGVMNRMSDISSNTGNLSTANGYINKKVISLEEKSTKLNNFKNGIVQFNEDAYSADKRVASRIKESRKDFTKRENIPGVLATAFLIGVKTMINVAGKVLEAAAECGLLGIIPLVVSHWDAIMAFYQEHKYIIDVIIDVIAIAAAVATLATVSGPFMVLGLLAGSWALAKGMVDISYDIEACKAYYIDGNEELAKELNATGMEQTLKTALGEDLGGFIYTSMETVSSVYGVCELGRAGSQLLSGNKALSSGTDLLLDDKIIKASDVGKWRTNHIIKNVTGIKLGGTSWDMVKNTGKITKTASLFLNNKPIEGIKSVGIISTATKGVEALFNLVELGSPAAMPIPVWCM